MVLVHITSSMSVLIDLKAQFCVFKIFMLFLFELLIVYETYRNIIHFHGIIAIIVIHSTNFVKQIGSEKAGSIIVQLKVKRSALTYHDVVQIYCSWYHLNVKIITKYI